MCLQYRYLACSYYLSGLVCTGCLIIVLSNRVAFHSVLRRFFLCSINYMSSVLYKLLIHLFSGFFVCLFVCFLFSVHVCVLFCMRFL